MAGRLEEAIGLRERAYKGFSAAGDEIGAARLALVLSEDHAGRGSFAVSGGWFATAERLLEAQPERAEHAHLALTRAVNALFAAGDLPEAIRHFDRAHELGQRFRDRDTQVLALSGKGRALIKSGELEAGLALLDEASAAAVCGELRAVLDRDRLLHDDHVLPGRRRLPACRRVDGGGQPLVRPAGCIGLPGGMPHPPGRAAAAPRRPAGRREAGARGLRGAAGLRALGHRRGLLRDRRDPAAARRLRRGRGGVPAGERVRS